MKRCQFPFASVWVLDFEFIARDGEHPEVICLVACDIVSGRWVRIWKDDFSDPPFNLNADSLFVAYSASAEWSCFIALGWHMPARCLDLYAEFTRVTNGSFESKIFPSLIAAATHFGIEATDADHKGAMRDLILSGGPWGLNQQKDILNYCEADVRMTANLLFAMSPRILCDSATLGGVLLRGRYTCAVAKMEWNGVPFDSETLKKLSESWEHIKFDLIKDIDKDFGVFEGTSFSISKFSNYIATHQIPWPRLPSGQIMLDDDTFRERAKSYPKIAPLRELRHAIGKMRLNRLCVGKDGRNRTGLMPFGSKTGRNQPSNSRFAFGTSRWLRSLIQPTEGQALAYVDWVSQEIAIAAALSNDEVLWEAYASGDPYMTFAKQAGLVPENANKLTHKAERQRAKAIVLGVGYGMSAESISSQAGLHLDVARDLLNLHKLTYRKFWGWAGLNQNAGLLGITLHTTFGWTWQAGNGTRVNPRSLLNWPMQANGAEMMRLACCELTEREIVVCCPVHDALLVEGATSDIESIVDITRAAMERASELVLGKGRVVRTEADIVRFPDRFADEAGIDMWNRVMRLLQAQEN
jgi:DNA polymerase I